jgi:hypothetical protein
MWINRKRNRIREDDRLKIGVREWAIEQAGRMWKDALGVDGLIGAARKLESYVLAEIRKQS